MLVAMVIGQMACVEQLFDVLDGCAAGVGDTQLAMELIGQKACYMDT